MSGKFSLYARTGCVLALMGFCLALFSPAASGAIQEEVVAMIEMEVALHSEYLFMAGDPPAQAHIDWEGGYRHTGPWTFVRFKGGQGYFVSPGRKQSPEMPHAGGAKVVGSHTCINGEGFVMGKRSFALPVTDVRAAWPEIEDAGGGKFWMFVGLPEFTVEPPVGWSGASGECPAFDQKMGGCVNGPPWRGPESRLEEDELPEAAVVAWKDLVAAAKGSGPSITFGFEHRSVEEEEDSFGFPVRETIVYRVKGTIHPEGWLDIEPLRK